MGKYMNTKTQQKSRNWIFTIHNYNKKILRRFGKVVISLERHTYICFGLEKGKTGETRHIQGYIELDDNQALTFTQNYFNLYKNDKLIKFHLEAARGSAKDSQKYTSKEGQWWEFGTAKNQGQGKRNDLDRFRDRIYEDPKCYLDILRTESLNYQSLRFVKEIVQTAFNDRDPEMPPTIIWLHGKSGSGKTSTVHGSFDSVCKVSNYKWPGNKYIQQTCLLFDDFRSHSLDLNELLNIIDIFAHSLELKGGMIPINSPYIVITTPHNIEETFSGISKHEDLTQVYRRVTHEIEIIEGKNIDLKTLTTALEIREKEKANRS
jgi:hypothetical protein